MRVTIILLIISILLAGFFACTKIGDLKSRDNPLDPNGINYKVISAPTVTIMQDYSRIVVTGLNVSEAEKYIIYWKKDSSINGNIQNADGNSGEISGPNYLIQGLVNGATYYIVAVAKRGVTTSSISVEKNITLNLNQVLFDNFESGGTSFSNRWKIWTNCTFGPELSTIKSTSGTYSMYLYGSDWGRGGTCGADLTNHINSKIMHLKFDWNMNLTGSDSYGICIYIYKNESLNLYNTVVAYQIPNIFNWFINNGTTKVSTGISINFNQWYTVDIYLNQYNNFGYLKIGNNIFYSSTDNTDINDLFFYAGAQYNSYAYLWIDDIYIYTSP